MKYILTASVAMALGAWYAMSGSIEDDYPELFGQNVIIVFTDPEICLPCARYELVLKEARKTHRIACFKPSDHRKLQKHFNIASIPTTVILVNKEERARHVGNQSLDALLSMPGAEECKLDA